MIAFLNQNDIDNLKLAIDKMKGVDFDAARKMELLLEAYEKQDEDDREVGQYRDAIECLPGYPERTSHLDHVKHIADLLERASDGVQRWDDSRYDEPLDEAVKRLVVAAEATPARLTRTETALTDIISEVDAGEPDALSRIREIAAAALS